MKFKEQDIKQYLRELICESMYMEDADLADDELFFNFGLESVTLVKILAKISTRFSCTVTVNELVAHQTVSETSAYIYQKIVNEKVNSEKNETSKVL